MALRQDPVRLLIADDVGIGKTVEACLIARELLDRGEIQRLAVLCPPHLAEQWVDELREKFHIEAEAVLTSTVKRLERPCKVGESLFDLHPFVVVSTDFIKSQKRRDDFIRACPEFVIVDEAHGCTRPVGAAKAQQRRFDLVRTLAEHPDRHVVLVTATPHNGKHEVFASLVGHLDPAFEALAEDPAKPQEKKLREKLAQHFIQRQRGNIRDYMDEQTKLPTRTPAEGLTIEYALDPSHRELYDAMLAWARGELDRAGSQPRARVRQWSILGLLRTLGSSPAAALATLQNRTGGDAAEVEDDEQPEVLDVTRIADTDATDAEGTEELPDTAPMYAGDGDEAHREEVRRTLRNFADVVEKLDPAKDRKLAALEEHLRTLLSGDDGVQPFSPIIFCRYVNTAEYLGEQLRQRLARRKGGRRQAEVKIEVVTGRLAPDEREARIHELISTTDEQNRKAEAGDGPSAHRILVCTDCLSEGVNLQHGFDAVIHYDLAWNPMRHEQREGRVDRFGQDRESVHIATLVCPESPIDMAVLDVLIRKHVAIRNDLGISVAVPAQTEQVIEALSRRLLEKASYGPTLPGFEDVVGTERARLHEQWNAAAERERRSRSIFAQNSIKLGEVRDAVAAVRRAVGDCGLVAAFLEQLGADARSGLRLTTGRRRATIHVTTETPRAVRHAMGQVGPPRDVVGWYDLPVDDGLQYLARTHPVIEGLAGHLVESALDATLEKSQRLGRRAGVSRIAGIDSVVTVLLLRPRYHLEARHRGVTTPMLVEEILTLGFSGPASKPDWIDEERATEMLNAPTVGNVAPEDKQRRLSSALSGLESLRPHLDALITGRCEALREAHEAVRTAAIRRAGGGTVTAQPVLPVDLLGLYVLLPGGNA